MRIESPRRWHEMQRARAEGTDWSVRFSWLPQSRRGGAGLWYPLIVRLVESVPVLRHLQPAHRLLRSRWPGQHLGVFEASHSAHSWTGAMGCHVGLGLAWREGARQWRAPRRQTEPRASFSREARNRGARRARALVSACARGRMRAGFPISPFQNRASTLVFPSPAPLPSLSRARIFPPFRRRLHSRLAIAALKPQSRAASPSPAAFPLSLSPPEKRPVEVSVGGARWIRGWQTLSHVFFKIQPPPRRFLSR